MVSQKYRTILFQVGFTGSSEAIWSTNPDRDTLLDPVYTGSGQIFQWIFLPEQPVNTEPCKFCYRLQYCLPFKNLHELPDPV